MKIKCSNCGSSDFTVMEETCWGVKHHKGTVFIYQELICDECANKFKARMNFELVESDLEEI